MPWDHKSPAEYYADRIVTFIDALLMGWTVSATYVLFPLFQDIHKDRGWPGLKKPLLLFVAIVIVTGMCLAMPVCR